MNEKLFIFETYNEYKIKILTDLAHWIFFFMKSQIRNRDPVKSIFIFGAVLPDHVFSFIGKALYCAICCNKNICAVAFERFG